MIQNRLSKLSTKDDAYAFKPIRILGFSVLGLILESVYGEDYTTLRKTVFVKDELGLKNTRFPTEAETSIIIGTGKRAMRIFLPADLHQAFQICLRMRSYSFRTKDCLPPATKHCRYQRFSTDSYEKLGIV
jgi:hypothetical protein